MGGVCEDPPQPAASAARLKRADAAATEELRDQGTGDEAKRGRPRDGGIRHAGRSAESQLLHLGGVLGEHGGVDIDPQPGPAGHRDVPVHQLERIGQVDGPVAARR